MNEEDTVTTTKTAKKSSFYKLLPLIVIAEAGFSAFLFGYFATVGAMMLLPIVPSLAAIVFTVLRALNIKPRFTETAAMICVSLSIFLYLLMLAVGNLASVSQLQRLLTDRTPEEAEFDARLIRQYTITGSTSLAFAVLTLPVSIYLPIWNLRRTRSNA